jgi:hypothetical protein
MLVGENTVVSAHAKLLADSAAARNIAAHTNEVGNRRCLQTSARKGQRSGRMAKNAVSLSSNGYLNHCYFLDGN